MPSPFKIFPTSGYLNAQFQAICFDYDTRVTIEKDGEEKLALNLLKDSSQTIMGLVEPGFYIAKCHLNGQDFVQQIEVKGSIRLGSSELKSAYVFDEIPYAFFLMKDRMHIFDERKKTMFFENNISPSEIYKIDNSTLLFVTKMHSREDEISNFCIYSIKEFKAIWEKVDSFREIHFDEEKAFLWTIDFKNFEMICYSLKTFVDEKPTELFHLYNVKSYQLIPSENVLLIEEPSTFTIININTLESTNVVKDEFLAIDKRGIAYHLTNNLVTFHSMNFQPSEHLNLKDAKTLDLSADEYYFLGEEFVLTSSSDFDSEIKRLIAENYPGENISSKSHFFRPTELTEGVTTTIAEIIPTSSGTYIFHKKTKETLNRIIYKRELDGWIGSSEITEAITYDLSYQTLTTNINVYKNISNYTLLYGFCNLQVLTVDQYTLFLKNGKIAKKSVSIAEVEPILGFNGNNYLLVKKSSPLDSFDLISIPENKTILENKTLLNKKYLQSHKIVWYVGKIKNIAHNKREVAWFDLNNKRIITNNERQLRMSIYDDAEQLIFEKGYCSGSNGILIDPRSIQAKDAVVGDVVCVSESLNKVVSRRSTLLYSNSYNKEDSKYHECQIEINEEKYSRAHLSPDGKFLMLQKQPNVYIYYDILLNQEIKFFAEKFISFSKEGKLIFEENETRSAKIIDPLTWKDVTPPNYHHYRFVSPDGKLYSSVVVKRKYFDKILEKQISIVEFNKVVNELDLPLGTNKPEIVEKVKKNREIYFSTNTEYFKKIGVSTPQNVASRHVVRMDLFGEIGIVGTKTVVEIPYPGDLQYFNYGAFSYDNNYYGYVGKPPMRGLLQLFKLDFDPGRKTLKVVDTYVSRLPNYACWVCGFSKLGYFATYDSSPNTFIIKIDDDTFSEKLKVDEINKRFKRGESTVFTSSYNWNKIVGKNFICFSPRGALVALSEQGYEPLTLGGYGHQDSPALHLASTVDGRILHSFKEHGDIIKEDMVGKLTFVAFSEDENKLMSMSRDGVVILRDIEHIKRMMSDNIQTNKSATY